MLRKFRRLAGDLPPKWVEMATAELKGKGTVERLLVHTPEGVTIKPIYTQEDLPKDPRPGPLPLVIIPPPDAPTPANLPRKVTSIPHPTTQRIIQTRPPRPPKRIIPPILQQMRSIPMLPARLIHGQLTGAAWPTGQQGRVSLVHSLPVPQMPPP